MSETGFLGYIFDKENADMRHSEKKTLTKQVRSQLKRKKGNETTEVAVRSPNIPEGVYVNVTLEWTEKAECIPGELWVENRHRGLIVDLSKEIDDGSWFGIVYLGESETSHWNKGEMMRFHNIAGIPDEAVHPCRYAVRPLALSNWLEENGWEVQDQPEFPYQFDCTACGEHLCMGASGEVDID